MTQLYLEVIRLHIITQFYCSVGRGLKILLICAICQFNSLNCFFLRSSRAHAEIELGVKDDLGRKTPMKVNKNENKVI